MEFNANENLNVSLTHLDLSNYTEEKGEKKHMEMHFRVYVHVNCDVDLFRAK